MERQSARIVQDLIRVLGREGRFFHSWKLFGKTYQLVDLLPLCFESSWCVHVENSCLPPSPINGIGASAGLITTAMAHLVALQQRSSSRLVE
jgi:hypothetical protein